MKIPGKGEVKDPDRLKKALADIDALMEKNADLEKLIAESMKQMLAKDIEIEILKLKVSNEGRSDTGREGTIRVLTRPHRSMTLENQLISRAGSEEIRDLKLELQKTRDELRQKERELEKANENTKSAVTDTGKDNAREVEKLKESLRNAESEIRRKDIELDELKRRLRDQTDKETGHMKEDETRLRETRTEIEQIQAIRKDIGKTCLSIVWRIVSGGNQSH
ncbi:periplakin-like [Leucoraja erinacea]|uniref:periplakin-like n=1 Tax=Leucoraja erinaceus TaxID=7782 RepID=UPI0024562572|nr:periplakin-like [Leucoraja erinacea]